MKAFVFTDEALTEYAGRFVWLALDMEKATNARYRKQLGVPAYPTFYVIDARDERAALRNVGAMNMPQLKRFLDDGRLAWMRHGEPAGNTPADSALARADRAYSAARDSVAAHEYRAALDRAPAEWPPYARAVEALLFAASRCDDQELCVTSAMEARPRLGNTPSAVVTVMSGLDCAVALPDSHPRRGAYIAGLLGPARSMLADTTLAVSGDDRSGMYISVGSALDAVGDSAGLRANTEAWSAFLDQAAARATTPMGRSVYDSHRLSAYLELGTPEKAIPMLEAAERDMPDDYNPPARLAIAYRAMKRWDDGLAAVDRAMARAYGPRKNNFYQLRADLLLGKGDREGARKALEDGLAYAGALPAGQRSEAALAGYRKRIATLQ
jgi:tetratricopeptide (TPR) repeat protein